MKWYKVHSYATIFYFGIKFSEALKEFKNVDRKRFPFLRITQIK